MASNISCAFVYLYKVHSPIYLPMCFIAGHPRSGTRRKRVTRPGDGLVTNNFCCKHFATVETCPAYSYLRSSYIRPLQLLVSFLHSRISRPNKLMNYPYDTQGRCLESSQASLCLICAVSVTSKIFPESLWAR